MIRALSVAACVLSSLCTPGLSQERPPNIVLILADDLGWGDVGFNGRTSWTTPNLDKLAAGGTIFKRWYTTAVVCAPSRAALMTGRYTIHSGVVGNSDDLPPTAVTVAAALKPRGYATALFGKWHHGRPRTGQAGFRHPLDLGFDESFGFLDAKHAWEKTPSELYFGREKKPVSGYSDTMFADHAVEFIARNKDKPFFLYLPFVNSHFHVQAPAEDLAEFKGKFQEKDPANPVNAHYAAMIVRLDKEIGRVTAALEQAGVADNTLVIFTSDHGATFEAGNKGASAHHDSNRPFRGQKRTLWEGGIRVPGVVRFPGRAPAGLVSHELVHSIDVMPTILAAAGAADERLKLDGVNLLPVWTGKQKGPQRTLFWEWRSEGTHQLAAMRGDMKLVITGREGRPELFDVAADLGERKSLAGEHPELVKQLQAELNAWLETETEEAKAGRPAPKAKAK